MRILAIEGALARCSVALVAGTEVLAAEAAEAVRGHPGLLPAMAGSVLRRGGAPEAVAVGVGPGGFTGLRAAIALAEGIAHGAGLELIGVTTGEALAAGLPEDVRARHRIWAAVDNRRGRVVLEDFAPGAACPGLPLVAPLDSLPPTEGAELLVLGDGAAAVVAALAARGDAAVASPGLPDAIAVARVAALRLAGAIPPRAGAPLYAEPPAVTVPA